MSVINSVLKDLDSKPTAFTPLDLDTVTQDQKKVNKPWLYPGLALALVLIILVAYQTVFKNMVLVRPEVTQLEKEDVALSNPQPVTEIEPPALPDQNSEAIERNEIIGLQIRENEEFMELEFQLAQVARNFLRQRSNNRYVFVVRDVENSIMTPLISDSPWLKQIQLSTVAEGIEIRFDTQDGVLVDTQERREDSAYYWLIRLKKSILQTHQVVDAAGLDNTDETENIDKVAKVEAVQTVQPAIEDRPSDQEQAQPIKLQIKPVQRKSPEQLRLDTALNAAKAGDYKTARTGLEQLLGGKQDYQAREHLLKILSQQNNREDFSSLVAESLTRYPNDEVFILYDANMLFSEKQYLALIEKYKSHAPNNQLYTLLATSYQRTAQHQLAAEEFIKALKINPQQPRLWISLAISQQHLSQREQALNSYQMALRSGGLNQRLHDFVQSNIRQLSN